MSNLGPVVEAVFALDLFANRCGAAFAGWRKEVNRELGPRLGQVRRLVEEGRSIPELLGALDRPRTPHTEHAVSQQPTATVFEFCQAAVIPYWPGVRSHLDAVRDARGRITIASGIDGLLRTLHPKIRWAAPYLEIPGEPDREVRLDGRGLLLSPSLFLRSTACLLPPAGRDDDRPALAFSVPAAGPVIGLLGDKEQSQERDLSALVGHTRAAALRVLIDTCTTGQLSQRLGISLAGASKHASVLRRAGLVTTERNRNTALHSLTSLGLALLGLTQPTTQATTAPNVACRL